MASFNTIKALLSFNLFFFLFNSIHAQPLHIVGSSTLFPFAATVAEHFAFQYEKKVPLIEAMGTGGGIHLFCCDTTVSLVMASRSMSIREKDLCKEKGVQDVVEIPVGIDGLILIQSIMASPLELTQRDLQVALLESHHAPLTWDRVRGTLPSFPIQVLGPPSTSGTKDTLLEFLRISEEQKLRQDGAYSDSGDNQNILIQKILRNPYLVGIVNFSFFKQHETYLRAIPVEGVSPSFKTLACHLYPLTRKLYLYVKKDHIDLKPEVGLYLKEFLSPEAGGEKGYLIPKGFLPLSPKGNLSGK